MRFYARGHRRSLGAALLAVLSAMMVACSGVPSSGPPVDYTQIAEPAVANPTTVPEDLTPLEVVRQFVLAMRSIDQDQYLTAARGLLTTAATANWQAGDVPTQVMLLVRSPRIEVDPESPETVVVTGESDGYLEADGSYVPTERTAKTFTFQLEQQDGQWRIRALPGVLIMRVEDFNIAYTSRDLFFLDHTASVVVPDRRWIVNRNTDAELVADLLVDRLLTGPSEFLEPAVRNEFKWVRLANNITVSEEGAIEVDLTYSDDPAAPQLSTALRRELAAQLVYTLATEVRDVVITLDGEPLDPKVLTWNTGSLNSFDPSSVPGAFVDPTQGWFVGDNGGIQDLDGVAMYGDAGNGIRNLTSAAMSAATGFVAAVGQDNGKSVLYLGEPLSRKTLVTRYTADDGITTPSFNRSGDEAWVVANGTTKPVILRILTSSDSLYPVDSSALEGLALPISALVLSPDGVRVAFVAGNKLYMAVIVYSDGGEGNDGAGTGANASLANVTMLRSELTVGAVSWQDSQNLLVAASDDTASPYRIVFRVGVDGRQRTILTTAFAGQDVDSLAAGPPVLAAYGGRVWELVTDESTESWVAAGVGGIDLSGGSPFYPR